MADPGNKITQIQPLAGTELLAQAADVRARYSEANPKSYALFEKTKASLPGANTRSVLHYSPFPVTIIRAKGAQVEDIDGHHYQDFLGEYTAGLYGHSHPVIIDAITKALENGLTFGGPNPVESKFAQLICSRFAAVERLRFCNSGTESNVLALSAARAFTGRTDILVVDGSYHGSVLAFAGNSPLNLPFPTNRMTFNNPESAKQQILNLDSKLAAVLVEPMIGAGGCLPADPEFLTSLRSLTEQTGALLIFDEVMTSRLGASGLHGLYGITPDLVTLGKYLGGGLSFGAFGGRADILDRFDPTRTDAWPHAGTFNNNTLSLSAGFAGLNDIFGPEDADAFLVRGDAFRENLADSIGRLQLPIHITGKGSMMAFHFCHEAPHAPYDVQRIPPELYELIHLTMMARGQFHARRGMINLSLPMADDMLENFKNTLTEVMREHAELIEQAALP
jgi:glutamate-1-semialdehyde 2,1-aminomutase